MAAPPERRPQRVLAQLIEKLETTKPSAGLVDPATDFAVCRQFALSVYARADKHDVRSAQTVPPTQTQVEAFSAAGTFLKTLDQSQFAGMYDDDLKRRQEYAEWRAWDLATAMHAGRQPSPVTGHADGGRAGSSSSPVFTAPPSSPPVQASSPAYPSLDALSVSTPDHSTTPTRPGSSVSSNAPLPPRPPPPPGAPPPGHRSPSMEPCTSPKSSDDQRWEPKWGNGGVQHSENDAVLYREREGGYKLARVVKVDNAVDPPGYVVEVDGAERSTEASRLAPAPKPRRRSDGGNNGGSDSDGCVDASAAFAPPSHARGGAEGGAEGGPSRSDMALAHEMAMEAAQCLDPSRGDHVGAKDFLVKALEALDSERKHDG
jgi:hypothetical protein